MQFAGQKCHRKKIYSNQSEFLLLSHHLIILMDNNFICVRKQMNLYKIMEIIMF